MADNIYPSAIAALAAAGINLVSDTIKVIALTAGYTYSSSHDNLDDVTGGARSATATLASKSLTAGVFDAADIVFTAVAAGSPITQLLIYKHTGTESTSTLILRIDSYAGLGLTPNGTDINLAWPNDANKILKIYQA